MQLPPLCREHPVEKGVAAHFSILAWRAPWTEDLLGYSACGCTESDSTEQLSTFHFPLPHHTTSAVKDESRVKAEPGSLMKTVARETRTEEFPL